MVDLVERLQDILSLQDVGEVGEVEASLRARSLQHIDTKTLLPYPVSVTAVPTPVQYSEYVRVKSLQPVLNRILDKLSRDKEFVSETLEAIAQHDLFAREFLNIYKDYTEADFNKISLNLNRHDFMFSTVDSHCPRAYLNGEFKLVEFNLIASSMACLSEGVYHHHKARFGGQGITTSKYDAEVNTNKGFAGGLKAAYDMYNTQHDCRGNSVVIMLSEAGDCFNYFDQQRILDDLEDLGVATQRYTWQQLLQHGSVRSDGQFEVEGFIVAVCYFRSGYDPAHYPSRGHWELRYRIDRSAAISVPSIRSQIVNMKLFQMLLDRREVVSRYAREGEVEEVMSLFHQTLSLTLTEEGNKNSKLGIEHPEDYVLKPQREGGGNNLWEEEMRKRLEELEGDPARGQYILMKRIRTPVLRNRLIRKGGISETIDTVSEFGFYSVHLTDTKGDEVVNEVVGPLVRTKCADECEGGVCVGISAIDSPFFV